MKYYLIILLSILSTSMLVVSCGEDDDLSTITVNVEPTVDAYFSVTQDNTGLVSITPTGEGVTHYTIDYGDGTERVKNVRPGETMEHLYKEGVYKVTITAYTLDGRSTSITKDLNVSFNPPSNVDVVITNDAATSKLVHVTVNADDAVYYIVDFGDGSDPVQANIGETTSHQYDSAGTHNITVVVYGAAIETVTETEEFEVTEILQPISSAPTPPARQAEDVISLFTSVYDDLAGTDFFPDWGQGGCCGSSWAMFDLDGDEMLQYVNLSYQGNQFASAIDVSQMEFVHFDFWTPGDVETVEISLISQTNGERPVTVPVTANEWTSVDIPISDFTDQDGFTVTDIFQIKYVGAPWAEGSLFVDNIYFWKNPSATGSTPLDGTWKMKPVANSLRVGPSAGSGEWWAIDDAGVQQRACFYDDEYIFNSDGSFQNSLGADTWVEGWQAGVDDCGAPVAPHDGSAPASFTYNESAGLVTLTGNGAYLGIPKAVNAGELPNVAVPTDRTYQVTFDDANNITIMIETGSGVWWTFEMTKVGAPASTPFDGTWKISPVAGSLRVGPSAGSSEWWAIDDAGLAQRACFYDDEYIFSSDGSFQNSLGTDTWLEGWQAGADECGTPVAPHDGASAASFSYDETAGTITLNGTGAYLGIPKAVNAGELPNVAVPTDRTYLYSFTDENNMTIMIETGSGVWWTFEMTKN